MAYLKVQKKTLPPTGIITPEYRYWKQFQKIDVPKYSSPITHISFSPSKPHNIAVTSQEVHILEAVTLEKKKDITRFKDVAYSGEYRSDGKLIVAGNQDNSIQVFDISTRIILRSIQEHKAPVHATKFASNDLHIISASDDTTVRLWDLPTQQELECFLGHKDYVRTVVEDVQNSNLLISGSYDHSIKVWDIRSKECVLSIDNNSPVESVVSANMEVGSESTSTRIFSAGENTIKVWDTSSGRLLNSFSNHQKTITSLAIASKHKRLLSGSIDHHIKVYDLNTYQVVFSSKVEHPILSVGLSPDGKILAAGTTSGLLHIRRRIHYTEKNSLTEKSHLPKSTLEILFPELYDSSTSSTTTTTTPTTPISKPRSNTRRYWSRGTHLRHALSSDDYSVEIAKKSAKLKPYDHYLKKFLYKNALDAVLAEGDALAILSVLEELLLRGGLRSSLSGRQPQQLMTLINHIILNINHPAHTDILLTTTNQILDIYGGWFATISRSSSNSQYVIWWRSVLNQLKSAVVSEAKVEKELLHLLGSIDTFRSSYHYLHLHQAALESSNTNLSRSDSLGGSGTESDGGGGNEELKRTSSLSSSSSSSLSSSSSSSSSLSSSSSSPTLSSEKTPRRRSRSSSRGRGGTGTPQKREEKANTPPLKKVKNEENT